jgi:pimeloyl-[acyl-carrier protein] methyl ester esterase
MKMPVTRLVLLPGMDGTGDLFQDFVRALPNTLHTTIVRYPADRHLSRSELLDILQSAMPASERFVFVAESYSSPLAIELATTPSTHLAGLVLCAGFATSPVMGSLRWMASFLSPALFRRSPPRFLIKRYLLGPDAPDSLVDAVRNAITSVRSDVLAARLQDVLNCDVRAELARVFVPILYLRGKRDRLLRPSALDAMLQIRPDLTVTEIDAPHLVLQRRPLPSVQAIVDFIHSFD